MRVKHPSLPLICERAHFAPHHDGRATGEDDLGGAHRDDQEVPDGSAVHGQLKPFLWRVGHLEH